MHAARHRALRELGAFAKQMSDHWDALADRIDGAGAKALSDGAAAASRVLDEVKAASSARDLKIGPAAMNAGRFARARPLVPDAVLEHNQAMRFALLDAQHLLTLIDYVGALSATEGDAELVAACAAWTAAVKKPTGALRRATLALAKDPDTAVAPISKGQKLGYVIGWLGEATDRRASRGR
jgi:hypothetical protein